MKKMIDSFKIGSSCRIGIDADEKELLSDLSEMEWPRRACRGRVTARLAAGAVLVGRFQAI
jgi:hypothetical protein